MAATWVRKSSNTNGLSTNHRREKPMVIASRRRQSDRSGTIGRARKDSSEYGRGVGVVSRFWSPRAPSNVPICRDIEYFPINHRIFADLIPSHIKGIPRQEINPGIYLGPIAGIFFSADFRLSGGMFSSGQALALDERLFFLYLY